MFTRWLTKTQAAEYLHSTTERIDELLRQGRFMCSVFDGIELIPQDQLDVLLVGLQKRPNEVERPRPDVSPVSPTPQPSPERYEVRPECRREQVEEELLNLKNTHCAKTLYKELKTSLDGSNYRSIPRKTVGARLARWCSPRREDARTRKVTPLARKISMLLFGFIVPRDD